MNENAAGAPRLITPRYLRRLAGDTYYERGEAYHAKGAVRSIRPLEDGIAAKIRGTHLYQVRLQLRDGELLYRCDCPIGRDDQFCKHCVAAGLAWHAGTASGEARDGEPIGHAGSELHSFLMELDKEELVSLLLEQADADERLHRRLTILAAGTGSDPAHQSAWKHALDAALWTDDMIDYRDTYDYVRGIEDVVASLPDLLQNSNAENVIRLAEYGIDAVEEHLPYVDDSDGGMGDVLYSLQDLHLRACEMARPDPVELAERLFEAEMHIEYDTFSGAALTYAEILGDAGLEVYRRLAGAEWAKVPALGPGDEDPDRFGNRFKITSIMEGLARADEDFDALIAIKSHDLSMPYDFLQIAMLYRDTGDAGLALDWAERGWKAFSGGRRDDRLRAFIADIYRTQGRHEDAMALVWDAFRKRTGLDTYRELNKYAQWAGQWPSWREKALSLIRKHTGTDTRDRKTAMRLYGGSGDRSLLVQIFLGEDDPEAAWDEARAGGCAQHLWLTMAKTREKSHPDDAVQIYRDHIDALLCSTGNHIYEEAVGYLGKIETIALETDTEEEFLIYASELRERHKRKRNLIKLFDQQGW